MTLELKTLEEFLENQCGMVTPNLLELYEPHREFVEKFLNTYNNDPDLDLSDYITDLWQYLPEPNFKS